MNSPFLWDTKYALKSITDMTKIRKLYIAVAFIEDYGVDWIENIANHYKIAESNVEIFLSYQFSSKNPGKILQRLRRIGKVYICSPRKLHAKIVVALDNQNIGKLVMGSANLTFSGMNTNLELSNTSDINYNNSNIKFFFEECRSASNLITDKIIEDYLQKETILSLLDDVETAEKITRAIFVSDPQLPDKCVLQKSYFTYEDYETLFPRNATLNTSYIKNKRLLVQDKLLELHKILIVYAESLDLHCHWRPEFITSTITPSKFNHYTVSWIGIRYGKSDSQIERLNPGATKADNTLYSFPNHGCIQVSINSQNFTIALFHSVRHNAWDRAFVKDRILKDTNYIKMIINELNTLKGYGYEWAIYDPITEKVKAKFNLDTDDINTFPEFYNNDEDGYESELAVRWQPDSQEILSIIDIENLVKKHMKLLKPLYEIMVQK